MGIPPELDEELDELDEELLDDELEEEEEALELDEEELLELDDDSPTGSLPPHPTNAPVSTSKVELTFNAPAMKPHLAPELSLRNCFIIVLIPIFDVCCIYAYASHAEVFSNWDCCCYYSSTVILSMTPFGFI